MLKLYYCHYFSLLKNLKLVVSKKQCSQKNFCTFLREHVFDEKRFHFENSIAFIHLYAQRFCKEKESNVITYREFETAEKKDEATFYSLIKYFDKNYNVRTGQTDFIEQALKHMKEFGVHRELKAYKKLLDLMPRKVFVADNKYSVAFMKFPRQQFLALNLLDQLEYYGVIPDVELGKMLAEIFGKNAHPTLKFERLLYWSSKFKNKSPWPLPKKVPLDSLLLGKMAVERITSVDLQTEISYFKTSDIADSIDKTWIISGQSKKQRELLNSLSPEVPIIVEGGGFIWLRDKYINYFVLKADCEPLECMPPEDLDDLSKMETVYFNPDYTINNDEFRSVHEQDDGIIYAVCVTGTSSKDSLLSWIRILQKKGNPLLEKVPILFRFRSDSALPIPFSDEVANFEGKM